MRKTFSKFLYVAMIVLLFAACLLFCGCALSDDDILSVRERVDKLRAEMTKSLGEAFIARDIDGVKSQFCSKSQALPDINEQIKATFDYIDGKVLSYRIGERGYESYGAEYGSVTDYEFDSKIFLSVDSGKEYVITFRVFYISEDTIKGMTAYSVSELHVQGGDYCRAGYYWRSPYDGECGNLAASLIMHLSNGNADEIEKLMCAVVSEKSETAGQIQAAISAFEGIPLFAEREDGLYNADDSEKSFTCTVLGCDVSKDKDGNVSDVWLHIMARSVNTDAGKKYDIDIVFYLKNDTVPQYEGISCFSVSDSKTNEKLVSVGEWIHNVD